MHCIFSCGNSKGTQWFRLVCQATTHFFNPKTQHRCQAARLPRVLTHAYVDLGVTDLVGLVQCYWVNSCSRPFLLR